MTDLSQETRNAVIKTLISKMNKFYILPDKATEFDANSHRKLESGHYDSYTDPDTFAGELTASLQSIVGDRHLGVGYSPDMYDRVATYEANPDNHQPDEESKKRWIARSRYDNNGFKRVERLAGNIGYIRLDGFHDASYAGEKAVSAMNFVSYCDALIFDLRQNGGGSPSMIQLISSYLFENRTHLNNFYDRHDDKTEQFWTQEHVQGKKLSDIPVYVLTSSRTFSAAEEFTYNLKNLKRATVIGETTGGGGHPVTMMTLADGFVARICRARAVNSITKTNWEGVGVEPHITVPQSDALAKAHIHAIETLLEDANDSEKRKLQWELDTINAMYKPVELDSATIQNITGRYGGYVIRTENAQVTYTMRGFPGILTAISENRFVDLEHPDVHLEFVSGDDGTISLKMLFRDDEKTIVFRSNES